MFIFQESVKRVKSKLMYKEKTPEKTTFYRLKILEEDESRGLVKINYIGYSNEWDEWRRREDIIELNDEDDRSMVDNCAKRQSLQMSPLNLYEQLATNIKLQLVSYRKRSPYCRISMNLDYIYFEGLIQRGSVISRTKHLKQVYTITRLSKLNDILGQRWYIRGLNSSGACPLQFQRSNIQRMRTSLVAAVKESVVV